MWNPPPPDILYNTKRKVAGKKCQGNHQHGEGYPSPRVSTEQLQRQYADSLRSTSENGSRGPFSPTTEASGRANNNSVNNGSTQDLHSGAGSPPHPAEAQQPTLFPSMHRGNLSSAVPHPRLEKVGPYLAIATLQAYTILTVVRCLADPVWIVIRTGNDGPNRTPKDVQHAEIGQLEKSFLACAIAFTMLSCVGVTLRILDKFPWLRRIPVITAYLEGTPVCVPWPLCYQIHGATKSTCLPFAADNSPARSFAAVAHNLLFFPPSHLLRGSPGLLSQDALPSAWGTVLPRVPDMCHHRRLLLHRRYHVNSGLVARVSVCGSICNPEGPYYFVLCHDSRYHHWCCHLLCAGAVVF